MKIINGILEEVTNEDIVDRSFIVPEGVIGIGTILLMNVTL